MNKSKIKPSRENQEIAAFMKRHSSMLLKILDIDPKMKPLVTQLWRHGYATLASCEGGDDHPNKKYIAFLEDTGDGWFERNARRYGLKKLERDTCCDYASDNAKFCPRCMAGVNGAVAYREESLL